MVDPDSHRPFVAHGTQVLHRGDDNFEYTAFTSYGLLFQAVLLSTSTSHIWSPTTPLARSTSKSKVYKACKVSKVTIALYELYTLRTFNSLVLRTSSLDYSGFARRYLRNLNMISFPHPT